MWSGSHLHRLKKEKKVYFSTDYTHMKMIILPTFIGLKKK